nr:hypothetical protein [Eubacterium sp. BIOML-A1]
MYCGWAATPTISERGLLLNLKSRSPFQKLPLLCKRSIMAAMV